MDYMWNQIFSSHEYFKNGNISYKHICDVAKTIKQQHALIGISTNCIDVAAKISGKSVKDFTNFDINKLANLKFMFLEDLELDNISPIEQLKELKIINCWNNQIDSLVPIKNMVKVKELYAAKNKLNNLKPLKELRQLEVLDLAENEVSYIGDLYLLNNLIKLDLSANNISDARFFYNFSRLKSLNLSHNKLGNVTALKDCKHLEELFLYGNYSLNTESVVDVKKRLPNCKIHVNYCPNGNREEEFFGFIEIVDAYIFFMSINESIEKQLYHVTVSLYETENNHSHNDFRNTMKRLAWQNVIEIVYSKGSAREKKRGIFFEEAHNVISVQYELR